MYREIKGSPHNLRLEEVTIPAGASLATEMIATQGMAIVGIIMPAAWTTADIGYNACASGNAGELQPVTDAGGNYITTAVSASKSVAFPQTDAIFWPFIQISSVQTKSATAVTQSAAAVVQLLLRKFLN
jgi:hypothetical protein